MAEIKSKMLLLVFGLNPDLIATAEFTIIYVFM